MRDDMYENQWSPFDQKWYSSAFDKYVSTADELFNTDFIIQQGFNIPDSDGSRSSIFRNTAVLNNSFNESKLRDTLKDIYLNNSHRLIASNHDNTHFYQWYECMETMELIPNTNICQFTIPTDTFIDAKDRESYKRSPYYRKWVRPEDILNNWNVFKWSCLLFINRRVYSDYELMMDDQSTVIRFVYHDAWLKNNYPVYIFKFDTNAACRIKVSSELCNNQWKWKLPISYINDARIANSTNIMCAFNKISDSDIRTDGLDRIEIWGGNLEFLKIEDGYIDLTKLSRFNKTYILSESTQYLWMSIMVPKFLHEYPIMLPTDVIYRPYVADFRKVITYDNMEDRKVRAIDGQEKQVYIDMNDTADKVHVGWKTMTRPIVLSDAYNDPYTEPAESFIDELTALRDLTSIGANTIEDLRFCIRDKADDQFDGIFDKLVTDINNIHAAYNAFLVKRMIAFDTTYESAYQQFINMVDDIKQLGPMSEWFDNNNRNSDKDFWLFISPQIYIPRETYQNYAVVYIMKSIPNDGILWHDISKLLGKDRFRRPIDVSDFWMFEYDDDDEVWRPTYMNITHHFPDVYTLEDPTKQTPELNRILKAFFFYSDTMNVNNPQGDIIRATPNWDDDMESFEYDKEAIYRDIFMEKFYWMGIKAIYDSLLVSNNRWEIIEYVIDNTSYQRFNQLFLNTMDPYFKMGLATYMKSDNYQFPFDDAIDKMNENINATLLGYKRVTNFEMYLNKTWIPSYFDYVVKLMDDWNPGARLVRRPRSSFDVARLFPQLLFIEQNISLAVATMYGTLSWVIDKLEKESYNLNIQNLIDVHDNVTMISDNINAAYDYSIDLDMDIYGIDDINKIMKRLSDHIDMTNKLDQLFIAVKQNIDDNNVYSFKEQIIVDIGDYYTRLSNQISIVAKMVQSFDIEEFMRTSNDLYTYLDPRKINSDDYSFLGYVNKFNDPWSIKVKDLRTKLYLSTSKMYALFDSDKAYEHEEVLEFVQQTYTVRDDLKVFVEAVNEFWNTMGYKKDQVFIDKLDKVEDLLSAMIIRIESYMEARRILLELVKAILLLTDSMDKFNISDTEKGYKKTIYTKLHDTVLQLSYIAGVNRYDDAMKHYLDFKGQVYQWKNFVSIEEEVFTKLIGFASPPLRFIDRLKDDEPMLNAIIKYLNTAADIFIPDTELPTYSDVYTVDEIELVNGGFMNKLNDLVIVPNLGVYMITEISDSGTVATRLANTTYYNSMYREPMSQPNPYDAITNGVGVGIMVNPIHTTRNIVINDDIVKSYIQQISSIIYSIKVNIELIDPRVNESLKILFNHIGRIKHNWDHVLTIYQEHMTSYAISLINDFITRLDEIITESTKFMNAREKVDIDFLISRIDTLLTGVRRYLKYNDITIKDYDRYDQQLQEQLNQLIEYTTKKSTWDDTRNISSLIDAASYVIKLYKLRVADQINNDEFISLCADIDNLMKLISEALQEMPIILIDLKPLIRVMINYIQTADLTKLQKDEWYRIKSVRVALEGHDYKVGDVVQIVPDIAIDGDKTDILDNDKILIKVREVINGRVTALEPIMDYALPYKIWGIRKTKSVVGNGSGMTVDIASYELQLSDCTIFQDESSDLIKPPQYGENDLFKFKFENIHDLNLQYEVFLGGKQIMNYHQRHFKHDDVLTPNNYDAIYINANQASSLTNSSIYIPEEHYFIYRIEEIDIVDAGAGYAINQTIYVDLDKMILKLKVTELDGTPYKGIKAVEILNMKIAAKVEDPSKDGADVITDTFNNIDDEFNDGYYDHLTKAGIIKPATRSHAADVYLFTSKRFDNLEDGIRNKSFMQPKVNPVNYVEGISETYGDPDGKWYLGSRVDNKQCGVTDDLWNGIKNVISPMDPMIHDTMRTPPDKPITAEYQFLSRVSIHKSPNVIMGDLIVPAYENLPKQLDDWADAKIGKSVIVENDITHANHRMKYTLRTFVASGLFVYDLPEYVDTEWTTFNIDFMSDDSYPDLPTLKEMYPDAPWNTAKSYTHIMREITDRKVENKLGGIRYNGTTYISNLTTDNLSVWNDTTLMWEDLSDHTKWDLSVVDDPVNQQWEFTLTYLEDGEYSYDMRLYLNKTPESQIENAAFKRNAIMNVKASLSGEVSIPATNSFVNTGRHLRIRKLFPYVQKQSYELGIKDGDRLGYEMNFKLNPYKHFKNQIHLNDVKVFNKTAGRYENIMDPKLFEVRFKDPKSNAKGTETQTKILQHHITKSGQGFVDGEVWAYNAEYDISIFGTVTSNYSGVGSMMSFNPIHVVNAPSENISLEFQVYQNDIQTYKQMGLIIVEFNTDTVDIKGDGYIHNVTNPLAPVPNEIKVIAQYDLNTTNQYEIQINNSPKKWKFIEDKWIVSPKFFIPHEWISSDRIYILTSGGRFPLFNAATNKPSFSVTHYDGGTEVTFLNLYKRYEHIEIHTTPYPMRSVYSLRNIPKSGYIDLSGKINKPLNKKYFEFWVNGKLLYDEVTIITPTKLFLHGLTSLKNFEIIEINRDPNEYFSDAFLSVTHDERPRYSWDYKTYLDDALSGTLLEDNYSPEEQEHLLSPVWKQVEKDHPEFKNYPPNVDNDSDIMVRIDANDSLDTLENPLFQFMIVNPSTIEGVPITDRTLTFERFGFKPMTDEQIIGIMNEEWQEEINSNTGFPSHSIMSDDEWYGITARMYDKFGNRVYSLEESAYTISDDRIIRINKTNAISRLVKNNATYDVE